eukprot:scaffold84773_cov59-Attheya_sp.AAC.1
MSIGMRSVDAAASCGSNPGIFYCNLRPSSRRIPSFVPSSSSQVGYGWAQSMRQVPAVQTLSTHTMAWWGAVSWSVLGHFAFQCARSCGSDACQCRLIGNGRLIIKMYPDNSPLSILRPCDVLWMYGAIGHD